MHGRSIVIAAVLMVGCSRSRSLSQIEIDGGDVQSADGSSLADSSVLPSGCDVSIEPFVFESRTAPVKGSEATSLVVGGDKLFYVVHSPGQGSFFSSATGAEGSFTQLASPSSVNLENLAPHTAYAPAPGAQGSLYSLVERTSAAAGKIARYDVASNAWSVDPRAVNTTHSLVVVDGKLVSLWAAGTMPLRLLDLGGTGPEVGATVTGLSGSRPDWMSRTASLTYADGLIYGVKNDKVSPASVGQGDRIFRFSPGAIGGPAVLLEDLGQLPFEIGLGSVLAALPPGFSGRVGKSGGLFISAGIEPSDGDGKPFDDAGSVRSDKYAVFDIACNAITFSTETNPSAVLPGPSKRGASAVVFQDHLYIKQGDIDVDYSDVMWVSR